MTLKALIFDVDGTLADTERDGHRLAFNASFKAFDLDWEWSADLYAQLVLVTGGKERIRHYIDQYQQGFEAPEGDLDAFIAKLHRDKTQRYVDLLANMGISLRPGVARLLREARAEGLGLAIATTTTPENVSQLLQASLAPSSLEWFDVIGAGEIVPHKKPASDIYDYVLAELGLAAHECLAIEDSNNGLRASLGAGVETLVTVTDYTQEQDFTGAVLVVDHLGEPDQPFTVLQGEAGEASYVDVEMLRRLHATKVV